MLDHLVYAAPDLEAALNDLDARLGVRPSFGGRHPGRGTQNALLDLGAGTYLEVIAPDPSQPTPGGPRPFGLDRLAVPRLVTWAAKAGADLDDRVAAARNAGYDLGQVVPFSRELPDGTLLQWRLSVRREPPGGGGLVPFLIDWGSAPHPSETAAHGCRLLEFHGEHPDPDSVGPLLAAVGEEMEVVRGAATSIVAGIDAPAGRVELR